MSVNVSPQFNSQRAKLARKLTWVHDTRDLSHKMLTISRDRHSHGFPICPEQRDKTIFVGMEVTQEVILREK